MSKKKKLISGDGWSFTPAQKQPIQPSKPKGKVKLTLQKRKNNKVVTMIENLPLANNDLKNLLRELKNLCATGGTEHDSIMELQGDHRKKIEFYLKEKGWI